MNSQPSLNNIDSLLFQLALQTRELSQKKNEINQQIKDCRADIAQSRSHIETIHKNIKKLEEEIRIKQSTVIHNKTHTQSMKSTNNLLLHYEQTLRAELETRKASYNHDMEEYEERIAKYRKKFQSHKEIYCRNPLAQKLLTLQAEKEEIEYRIKACDDQITMKQKELEHLTGEAMSSSMENLPDSVGCQQPIAEAEKQLDPQTEDDGDSSVDVSSLHLNQEMMLQSGCEISPEFNTGDNKENKVEEMITGSHQPEEASIEMLSYEHFIEQSETDETHTSKQEKETEVQDQVLELQTTVSEVEEAVEGEVEEGVTIDEDNAPCNKDNEGAAAVPQSSSPEMNHQSSPAKSTAEHSTPAFTFNFTPASSPCQGTSDIKSPAFLFSLNPDPSTPGFSGFGFDMASSQDEDSSFTFTGSFLNEKKTTESKSTCPGFLFDQSEQSENFKFTFTPKSPQTTSNDNTRSDFPFSFSF